jgi:hypothetical protein
MGNGHRAYKPWVKRMSSLFHRGLVIWELALNSSQNEVSDTLHYLCFACCFTGPQKRIPGVKIKVCVFTNTSSKIRGQNNTEKLLLHR